MGIYIESAARSILNGDLDAANEYLNQAHDSGEDPDTITILWRYAAGYGHEEQA